MATHLLQHEIGRFLSDEQPGVLVVAGKWGVGKTFAWNRFLLDAKTRGEISLKYYSYISLFGLGDLEDVRSAIFQNTVSREDIGKTSGLDTLKNVLNAAPSSWRKSGVISGLLPGGEKYSKAFEKAGFFLVKNQIICIDDLERKSKSLDIRDVLGLASQLKEQRQCKVVLLLNDSRFQETDEAEFREQLEKVADVTLRFEPSPSEVAQIGVEQGVPFKEALQNNCTSLGIVNIRTIKKIERVAIRLYEELLDFDIRIFEKALRTLTLLEFAKLQPAEAPSLSYIRSLSEFSTAFDELFDGQEQQPEQKQWQALLSSYNFTQLDEFDGVIFKVVADGHVDSAALHKEAKALEKQLHASDADRSFHEAWELYHGSFEDNAAEVTNALAAAIRNTPQAITPSGLSTTIEFLKELKWEGDIQELISGYINARSDEPRQFWDVRLITFGPGIKDEDVRSAFAFKLGTFGEDRVPVAILRDLAREKGWNPDDIAFLATLSVDDFYDILKPLRNKELKSAVAGALRFRSVANADEEMKVITANAVAALQRIGQESPINRRRIIQRGIDVPE